MRLNPQFGHTGGASDLAFISEPDQQVAHLITGGSDCMTYVRHLDESKGELAELSGHRDGITAVAASPMGDRFATASEDREVRVYAYPSLEFEQILARFTLPVRALAFSADGTTLAAAGDDASIKLVNVVTGTATRVFEDLPCAVRSLAYDPKGDLLASALVDGTVIVYSVETGEERAKLVKVAPKVDVSDNLMNKIAWRPGDGQVLAVPDKEKGVVFYDRESWQEVMRLKEGHSGTVSMFAWSPNGLY
eukprot:4982203-Pyramimonas_sp.AAC.3